MFNLFGYERKLNTQDLYHMEKLIEIYSIENYKKILDKVNQNPVIDLVLELTKEGDTLIDMKIEGLKIAIELKSLLTLSQLAITEPDIQPPKSTLAPLTVKKVEKVDETKTPSGGKTKINLQMTEFLGCLSDRTGSNYVVMEGEFFVNLNMCGAKPEDDIIALSKTQGKPGKFLDAASHKVAIDKFSFYFCNVNDLKNKRFILLPIRLNLNYGQHYAMTEEIVYLESEIDGNLEKIIVECSVRDMLLLSKIGQDNLQVMSEYNKNVELTKKESLKEKQGDVSELKKLETVADKEAIEKTK